jgi:hypothetical protein
MLLSTCNTLLSFVFIFVIDIRIYHNIFVKPWLEFLYEICKQVDTMRKYMCCLKLVNVLANNFLYVRPFLLFENHQDLHSTGKGEGGGCIVHSNLPIRAALL